MARDGSGNYARIVSDYVSGTAISSSDVNSELDDIGTALSGSLAKDGQTVATSSIPFAAGIQVDTIAEKTSANGVAVDGVTMKDGGVTLGASGNLVLGAAGTVIFEGATADAFETTLTVTDPTADRTITFPDETGTVALTNIAQTISAIKTFTAKIIAAAATIPQLVVNGRSSDDLAQMRFFANDGTTQQGAIQGTASSLAFFGPGDAAGLAIGPSTGTLGVTVGSPTGSFKGTGTLNAVTLYENGTTLADVISAAITANAETSTLGTAQATTSGTAFNFTSLPAEISRITMTFDTVSLSGSDNLLVQIGDSGGLETTGYVSSSGTSSGASSTSGFIVRVAAAGRNFTGTVTIFRVDESHKWIAQVCGADTSAAVICSGGGVKTLSAELGRITLTRTGSDTFDAGEINIRYWV